VNLKIDEAPFNLKDEAKLDLEYALRQCEELKLEINQLEDELAYKYPVYKLLKEADAGRKVIDYNKLFAAAENSGAYKSLEWFSLYLSLARQDVWHEVATLICVRKYGSHDFIKTNNEEDDGMVCRYCGCEW